MNSHDRAHLICSITQQGFEVMSTINTAVNLRDLT
jgi:hypothetical protein